MSRPKIFFFLYPFSWLYGLAVFLRNWLFDHGVLKSRCFRIPVIAVGNLAVGGTGKTPHIEYLVRLLTQEKFRVATLSRGYKRRSRGFVLANERSTMPDLGDEPLQMHRKFPDILVAVDANRCEGIQKLEAATDGTGNETVDVVLLDDAYQYRYVRPGISILLTDFNRPFYEDALLPAGRLREPAAGKKRADMIVVTKCPHHLKDTDFKEISSRLNISSNQDLFFTSIRYGALRPLFGNGKKEFSNIASGTHILLLTGIAAPGPLIRKIKQHTQQLTCLTFADHHNFTASDINRINGVFKRLSAKGKTLLLTTEKDATRLLEQESGLSEDIKKCSFVCPIEVEFLQGGAKEFNHKIISYVRKNSRNSRLAQQQDDGPSRVRHNFRNRTGRFGKRD